MRRNNYRSFRCYNKSNYGKPKYITREGYLHFFNGCNNVYWLHIPTYIRNFLNRLRESVIKLKILYTKVRCITIIALFKGEQKCNRIAYINQLINNLL